MTVLDALTAANVPTNVHHQGMVALVPEDRDLDRLVLDDGEPKEELHLTLAFLGEAEDLPDDVYNRLRTELVARAEGLTLLQGDAFAVSQFNPHGEAPCLVLGVGGAWLEDLRHSVLQSVGYASEPDGWELPTQHSPWVAHLTLAYDPTPEQLDAALERVGPVMFDRLRLAVGDETTDFDLTGGVVLVASSGEPTTERQLELRQARVEQVVSRALRRAVRAGTRSLGEVVTAAGGWVRLQEAERSAAAVSLDELAAIEEAWRAELLTTVDPAIARVYEEGARDARELLQELAEQVPVTPVDQRALAAEVYLGEADNRLRGIGTDLWRTTRLELSAGLAAGEDMDQLARRVRGVLATTDVRARTIARTEVIGASNAGQLAQMQASGLVAAKTWLSTADSRTRLSHRAASGQTVPLDGQFTVGGVRLAHPGDPAGPAKEVVNCVLEGTKVSFAGLRAVTRRDYDGPVVELILGADVDNLTLTPNHPVLTVQGWRPASELHVGDHVVRGRFVGYSPSEPQPEWPVTQVEEVYRLAAVAGRAQWVHSGPPDFHGDGLDQQVHVVAVDRGLRLDVEPASDEEVEKFALATAHLAAAGLSGGEHPTGLVRALLESRQWQSSRDVRVVGKHLAFLEGQPLHPQPVGFTSGPERKTHLPKTALYDPAAGLEFAGDPLDTLTLAVAPLEVVDVKRRHGYCSVYNLSTEHGWYISNHVITRNCRCTLLYQFEDLPEEGDAR